MTILSQIIIVSTAVLHCYFLYFEMFAWTTKGPKIFRTIPKDVFPKTKAMAANQGLYNGFIAAGLIWSLLVSDVIWSKNIALFFLICVLVAALYGAYSVSKKIFFIQGIPAILGIISLLL